MAVWKHKNAHDEYPVKAGDYWQVGNHIFLCGDLEGQTNLHEAIEEYPPDLMYADPPWNNGNARSFRTISGVDGEKGRPVEISTLTKTVLDIPKRLKILAFIEGGVKQKQMVEDAIISQGGVVGGCWNVHYSRAERPNLLFAADFRKNPINDYPPDLEGKSDAITPQLVLRHYLPKRVIDCCGGLGGTARSAEWWGVASLTHELSPYRTAEAIKLVAKTAKLTPIKIK